MLAGHLLLSSSERYSLCMNWKWMFSEKYVLRSFVGETYPVDIITDILTTFPPLQHEIYLSWAVTHDNNHILAKSYLKWVTHLIEKATKREPNLEGEGVFADTSYMVILIAAIVMEDWDSAHENGFSKLSFGSCSS